MKLKAFGMTDIGRIREENQDNYLVDESNNLLIVTDGMGGMENGAAASLLTIQDMQAMISFYEDKNALSTEDAANYISYLKKCINQISERLRNTLGKGSGSTLVLAKLIDREVMLMNVGDSPGYLFRNGHLQQITRDHNAAEALFEMKMITHSETKIHPLRNRLTAFVGMNGVVFTSFKRIPVNSGDRVLLCTDGLTGMVDEQVIEQTLEAETGIEAAVLKLVELANNAGGADNVTVVLAEVIP